jgi:hypothetical protein
MPDRAEFIPLFSIRYFVGKSYEEKRWVDGVLARKKGLA